MNAPGTEHEGRLGVEAWRGLAAWLVVFTHLGPVGGMDWPLLRFAFTGVDLFFVLSGFVFAPYLWGKPLPVLAFGIRRLLRIYPAYLLALGVYVALKLQAGHAPLYLWEHLTFTQVQSREMAFYYNPPFWSLPAEVEFYLLLPLLAWALGAWRAGWVALAAAALLMRLALGWAGDSPGQNLPWLLTYHLPGLLLEFLLGALAWRICERGLGLAARLALGLAGLAGWALLAALFARLGDAGLDATWLKGQVSWLAALCFAGMVTATLSGPKGLGRVSGDARSPTPAPAGLHALALWAGRLSYGTYLFHLAALQLLQPFWATLPPRFAPGLAGAASLLTLAMAWACYRFWEEPCRRWGRAQAARFTR
jgi:peptidoglycan/LPS O-acetylase OafA/YrhL